MRTETSPYKLYSVNAARKLLAIGASTLFQLINSGEIGVIKQPSGRYKIPQDEIERYLRENTIREKRKSLIVSTGRIDLDDFVSGKKRTARQDIDSTLLFNKIMEQFGNGQRIQ